uniref:Peptidase M12B domain-containing protein n=2 Tax=Clytia hemisphaerica TaxID=252671 RepID=A0A7M5XEW6_9CNID
MAGAAQIPMDDAMEVPESLEQAKEHKHSRQRRSTPFDPARKECLVLMVADYTYVAAHNYDIEEAYLKMATTFDAAKQIYEQSDFDGDGNADGITLRIGGFNRTKNSTECVGDECRYNSTLGINELLTVFTTNDHGDYCLASLFVDRNFAPAATIGLAWVGVICETYKRYRLDDGVTLSDRTYNTNWVTINSRGTPLTDAVVEIVTAHEFGHNYGSDHDNSTCQPSDVSPNGYYIMNPTAPQNGNLPNERQFSRCSLNEMWAKIQTQGGCFKAVQLNESSSSAIVPQPSSMPLPSSSHISPSPSQSAPPMSTSMSASPQSSMPPPQSSMPPPQSSMPPPPPSSMPPPQSSMPPPQSSMPPPQSSMPPPQSSMPPPQSSMPPPQSSMPPPRPSSMPPPQSSMPPPQSSMPPRQSSMPPPPQSSMPPPQSSMPPRPSSMPLPQSSMQPPQSSMPPPPPSSMPPPQSSMPPRPSSMQPPQSSMQPPQSSMPPRPSSMPPLQSSMTPRPSSMPPLQSSMPPPQSSMPPPPSSMPPLQSSMPPRPSSMPPPQSSMPPPPSSMPPRLSSMQPPQSSMPPPQSSMPPPQSSMPPRPSSMPPPQSSMPPPQSSMPPRPSSMQPPQSSMQPPQSSMPPPQSSMPPRPSSIPPPQSSMPPRPSSMPPPQSSMPPQPSSMQPPHSSMPPRPSSMQPPQSSMPPRPSSMPPPQSSMPPPQSSMLSRPSSMPPRQSSMPPPQSSMPPRPSSMPPLQSSMPPRPSSMPPLQSSMPPPQSSMPPQQSSITPSPSVPTPPATSAPPPTPPPVPEIPKIRRLSLSESCDSGLEITRVSILGANPLLFDAPLSNSLGPRLQVIKNNGASAALPNENVFITEGSESTCEDATDSWGEDEDSKLYQNMVCLNNTKYGAANLTYIDGAGKQWSIIMVKFIGNGGCKKEESKFQKPQPGSNVITPKDEENSKCRPAEATKPKSIRATVPQFMLDVVSNPKIVFRTLFIWGKPPPHVRAFSSYSLLEKFARVDGIRLLLIIEISGGQLDAEFEIGGGSSSKRRRRRSIPDNPVVDDTLGDGESISIAMEAVTNSGASFGTPFSAPLSTLPAGVEPGVLCEKEKDCVCLNVAEVNSTYLNEDITFNGLNDTQVNSSLTAMGKWSAVAVQTLCKDVQCNATALLEAENGIQTDLTLMTDDLNLASTTRLALRKQIDCALNNGTRSELFDKYEGLCKRIVYISSSKEDLSIKKTILEKERIRCDNRSWLRRVLEDGWRKN